MADFAQLEQDYGLPPGLLSAVTHKEDASGDPNAVSPKGAVGTFQFMPGTAEAYGVDPNDPESSAVGAAKMFADLKKQYNGDLPHMLAAYNWGSGNLAKHGMENAPKETRDYIAKIAPQVQAGGTQVADSGEIATDAPVDTGMDKDKLLLLARARLRLAQKNTASTDASAGVSTGASVGVPAIDAQKGSMLAAMGNNIADTMGGAAKDIGSSTLDSLKNTATQTGAAVSEPLNNPAASGMLAIPDAILRTVGKAGNALGGAYGAIASPLIGALTASQENNNVVPTEAKALKAALASIAPDDSRFNNLNSNLSPEKVRELSQGQAADLSTAVMLGMGANQGAKNAGTFTEPYNPFSNIDVGDLKSKLADLKNNAVQFKDNLVEDWKNPPPEPPAPPPPPSGAASLAKGANGQPLLITPKAMNSAQDILRQVLQDEGIKPEDVAAQLEEGLKTGKPLTALDMATKEVGGVQTQGKQLMALAKAAANMPGQGASMAGETAARGLTAGDRIGQDFDKGISNAPFYNVKDDAIQTQQGSGPLYQEAYKANPSVQSPEIDSILSTPAGKQALKNAVTTMQDSRSLVGVNDPDLLEQAALTGQYEPGDGGIASGLKMKTLDLVKQHLWDLAEKNKNDITGRDTTQSRAIKQQMQSLTNELDKADATNKIDPDTGEPIKGSGLYAQGRKAYSTGARQESALEKGREFMTQDPEEIKKFISDENTSDPEKLAFAAGVRRAIQDKLDSTNDGSNPINKVWKQNVRSRIRPLFPDEESFNQFANNMEHEQTMARVNNNYNAGSPTAPNLQYQGAIGAPQKILKAITSPQSTAIDMGLGILNKKLQKAAKNMSKETAAGIVRHLTTNDPQVWRDLAASSNP